MDYTLFIFRRDLRLIDNISLNYAIKNYSNILPIFIFTPEQIEKNNTFRSENSIQFMIESIKNVDKYLKKYNSKMHLFYGDNIEVLNTICNEINVKNIIFNKDYTPYAIKRDKLIEDFCNKNKINIETKEDYLLAPIGTFLKEDKNPYTVFTPFRNNGFKFKIIKPVELNIKNLVKIDLKSEYGYIDYNINNNISVNGGRDIGLEYLKNVKKQENYNNDRNTLSINTSMLSAFIKFGCISIREVYWKIKNVLGSDNDMLSQLFWREFYYYIAFYFPKVLNGKNYNNRYDKIEWNKNDKYFKNWCKGSTGFPIIDAGMNELNKTGYMHNRARLITSNFMNRMLGLDWREGERYYATQLTDYDPSVNNGNWQWIASTGVDPKPYFQRLFNPWLQSKKFDPDCKYIKKWLPSLKNIPNNELHQWDKFYKNYDLSKIEYYKPIIDYKSARKDSITMYRKV